MYKEAEEMSKFRQIGAWIVNTYAKESISAQKILRIPLIDNDSNYIEPIRNDSEAYNILREVRGF